MGKIIDIMISMTQIMSPLIEYHLIIGITILLFILNNINIKNNKLKLFRRLLITFNVLSIIIFNLGFALKF